MFKSLMVMDKAKFFTYNNDCLRFGLRLSEIAAISCIPDRICLTRGDVRK